MIEINLLAPEFRKKGKKDKAESKVPDLPYLRILVSVLAALVVAELLLGVWLVFANVAYHKLGDEAEVLAPDFERIKEIRIRSQRSKDLAKELDELSRRPFYWTELLNALADSVTEDVWITQVGLEKKSERVEVVAKRQSKEPKESGKPKDSKASKDSKDSKQPRKAGPPRSGGPKMERQVEYYLSIRGATMVSGQGTAAIGKFMQSFQENPFFKKIVSDAKIAAIDRLDMKGTSTFQFTALALLKDPPGRSDDPF